MSSVQTYVPLLCLAMSEPDVGFRTATVAAFVQSKSAASDTEERMKFLNSMLAKKSYRHKKKIC